MTATEIYAGWGELSLYTNAESCPMFASAIRWSGFKGKFSTSLSELCQS
jgi:tRNA(Arg) A34 adenosine deaminase TadA